MNTFSAFRSAAIQQILHPNIRLLLKPLPHETLRAFHVTAIHRGNISADDYFKDKEADKQKKADAAKARQIGLRGSSIPYEKVKVRTGEGLSDMRPLSDVLDEAKARNAEETERVNDTEESSSRFKKRYQVELIRNDPYPLVAIIDTKADFEKKKRTQEKSKVNSVNNVTKEIQLTWASSAADVENRVERMKDDLRKGYRIDLAISPKKRVPVPQREEMEERMQGIVSQFAGFAKEWRARQYTRTTAVAYLQGIAVSSAPIQEDAKRVPKGALLKQERKQKEEERKRKKLEREAQFNTGWSEKY